MNQIKSLLKKTNISNKDVLAIISCVIDLLLVQRRALDLVLEKMTANLLAKDEKIRILEAKILNLQSNLQHVDYNSHSRSEINHETVKPSEYDSFSDVQKSSPCAMNNMALKVPESSSSDSANRVEHNLNQFKNILNAIGVYRLSNSKILRVGGIESKPRPIKVMYFLIVQF